jgi:hypothetical protein
MEDLGTNKEVSNLGIQRLDTLNPPVESKLGDSSSI